MRGPLALAQRRADVVRLVVAHFGSAGQACDQTSHRETLGELEHEDRLPEPGRRLEQMGLNLKSICTFCQY